MNKNIKTSIVSALILLFLMISTYLFFELPTGQVIDDFSYTYKNQTLPYQLGTIIRAEDQETLLVDFNGIFDRPNYESIGLTFNCQILWHLKFMLMTLCFIILVIRMLRKFTQEIMFM